MNSITLGAVAQHTPRGTGGRPAAVIDIAEDLLLAELDRKGIFDHLVFKGGTALRKLYAGNAGRFSTDLDFSVRDPSDDPETIAELLCEAIDGYEDGQFKFRIETRRGRPHVMYQTPFGDLGNLSTKIDIGPTPWLEPVLLPWIRLNVHRFYDLPEAIPAMALEENMAEKIARLSGRTLARDVYDLTWIARTSPHSNFSRPRVRRLAILKNWVDQYGLSSPPANWSRTPNPTPYQPNAWSRVRRKSEFDDESIGLLASPPPDLENLASELQRQYIFLAQPDEVEGQIIEGAANSRTLVIDEVRRLDGSALVGRHLR